MLSSLLAIKTSDIILNPTTDANFWPRFLMQLMLILVLCKLLGVLLSYVKQVQVIGEILAGIIVGPTVLGQWGWWSTYIFPTVAKSPASNNYISLAADVGIVLFMFYVGLDLNEALVRKQWKRAMPVAAAAIAFPFCLGLGLGAWLYDTNNGELAVPVGRTAFYLFIGSSMSFTALPVLASLLSATGLIATPIGVQTISSATLDDVLAWCMLAISSAFAKGDASAGGVTVALSAGFIFFMFAIVRPSLARLHRYYRARNAEDSHTFLFIMMLVLLGSAFYCEVIQIHSFFGGFIAGLVAPKAGFWHIDTANRLELITRELLLPLFFVSSGSRTNISSIKGSTLIAAVFVVWIVATAGKFLPACLVTKLVTRRSWRYATTVGVLMNTRGLVELIALNVGFSLGILSQQLFSVLVLMALLTTFCTSPLVHLLWIRSSEGRTEMAESQIVSDEYAAEVSFQRTIAHLSLKEQDSRMADFKAERDKRKQQQQAEDGQWAGPDTAPMAGQAGSFISSSSSSLALSPLPSSQAALPLHPLSDEQRRVEQRYTLHAMGSVSDAEMDAAGDTQQIVFHPIAVQRELSRQRSSHRGSLELESHVHGLAGVQPDDVHTPKHFLQSGGSLMRSAGRGELTASQGRMVNSGSHRVDLQHRSLAEGPADVDADEGFTAPLNRSGPAGDGLVLRSGSSRASRAASPRGAAVSAGFSSSSADSNGLHNSGSLNRSAGGRTVKRTPHPADEEN